MKTITLNYETAMKTRKKHHHFHHIFTTISPPLSSSISIHHLCHLPAASGAGLRGGEPPGLAVAARRVAARAAPRLAAPGRSRDDGAGGGVELRRGVQAPHAAGAVAMTWPVSEVTIHGDLGPWIPWVLWGYH